VEQNLLLANLTPGKRITLRVSVTNTGRTTWYKQGAQRTGLNTVSKLNHASKLASPSWLASWRPARMKEEKVKPGETAHFAFTVTAPKRPGVYYETMQVGHAVSGLVSGTEFRFVVTSGQRLTMADFLRGRLLAEPAVSAASDVQTLTLSFKNTGRWAWLPSGPTAVRLTAENANLIPTTGWVDATTPAVLTEPVKPGATASFTFRLNRPVIPGNYSPTFRLVAGKVPVTGATATVPLAVDGSVPITSEPTVRVGLFSTTKPVTVTASADVTITDGSGAVLGTLAAGTTLTDTFDPVAKTHAVTFGTQAITADGTLRLVANGSETIQTITSYENRPGFNSTLNDNTFRGSLEMHFAPSTGKLWVINELPMESYLAGLAEGSNSQPSEYLKTLATAARSYALWHYFRNTKHADENYHLNATTDQVYRGEGFERRATGPVAGVVATRGVVMLHANAVSATNPFGVALGAYSACTDGRTRSFSERFGGDQSLWPWLVSVPDPNGICTNTTYLAGGGGNHMVGMSAVGARYAATTLSQTFDQILPYYYTGVSVTKIY
jgi:hypothetical protein